MIPQPGRALKITKQDRAAGENGLPSGTKKLTKSRVGGPLGPNTDGSAKEWPGMPERKKRNLEAKLKQFIGGIDECGASFLSL